VRRDCLDFACSGREDAGFIITGQNYPRQWRRTLLTEFRSYTPPGFGRFPRLVLGRVTTLSLAATRVAPESLAPSLSKVQRAELHVRRLAPRLTWACFASTVGFNYSWSALITASYPGLSPFFDDQVLVPDSNSTYVALAAAATNNPPAFTGRGSGARDQSPLPRLLGHVGGSVRSPGSEG